MLELVQVKPKKVWIDEGQIGEYKINLDGEQLLDVDRYDGYHASTWRTFMSISESVDHVIRTKDEYVKTYYSEGAYPDPTVLIEHGFGRQPILSTPLYDLQQTQQLVELTNNPHFSLFRLELVSMSGGVAMAYDHLTPPLQGIISTYDDAQVVADMVRRSSILRKDFSTTELVKLLHELFGGLPQPS
jgi:hypothetical protein